MFSVFVQILPLNGSKDNITLDKMGKKESNALREIRKYRESEKIKSKENTEKKKPNLFENFIDKVKDSENGATPDDLPSYDQFKGQLNDLSVLCMLHYTKFIST